MVGDGGAASPGGSPSAADDADDIGPVGRTLPGEDGIGPRRGRRPDELGQRLAGDGRGTLEPFGELGVETETLHLRSVSR